MIDTALVFLKNQLGIYLKLKTGENEKIHLANITDNASKTVAKDLTMSLVNVQEERILRNQNTYQETGNGKFSKINPELNLNLYILFTANFGEKEINYQESLKFLSHIAGFFQARSIFTQENTPGLDERIKKLVIDMQSLSFDEQSNLWSSLGTGYLPSLLYKVSMISLQEKESKMEASPVTDANLFDRSL